ncbi:MAG: alpha/beta hydrolase [Rubrivivax sp.]
MRRLTDPAWLEQQYDNRARVPEYAAHFQKWTEASALTRQQSDCTLDIAYGGGAGETLDLFRAQAPGAPVLVFIHGGYWRSLDKSQFSFVAASFNAAGAMVVVPDYALAPAVSIEHIALQMTRVLAWVWQHAAAHGGDPSRIVVAGHSAGGHLAAMLLSCRWKEVDATMPAQPLAGALSISGLYDLEPLRLVPPLQKDLQLTPASVRRLSPAFFPRPRARLFTVAGALESEEFLRQNQLIRDQWGPTAVPVCETVPRADHFSILRQLADPDARLHALGRQLLGL